MLPRSAPRTRTIPRMFTLMLEGQEDVTVADWLAYAEAAERLGYDGFFTSDHYFSVVGAEGRGSLDVWGVLCALAAVTKRIQLGTMVSPVTFRPPVVLAKLALVADGLSGGRVEVGLGTGWHETEHRKFGLPFPPFAERLQMLAEQAEIIRRLTDGETLDFSGAHYTLQEATLLPRPASGRLPILFGGSAKPKVAALAAKWADGYNLSHATPEIARAARERLDAACEAIGRDPATLPLSVMASLVVGTDEADYRKRQKVANAWGLEDEGAEDAADVSGTPARAIERIAALREAGVTRFFLNRLDHRDLEMVELVATEVLPHVR
jgi:alkanesulfonate monooxygenase SsuD/methylene tetrahydromethanopterin reductase-like flavin-dependent oxidoreductase (luciferase family)